MSQRPTHNRRIVLASRPSGAPVAANFRLEETLAPAAVADHLPSVLGTLLRKQITLRGFLVSSFYAKRHLAFLEDMSMWIEEGGVRSCEDIVDGLEHAPEAFTGLLQGRNFGKLIVRVGDDT